MFFNLCLICCGIQSNSLNIQIECTKKQPCAGCFFSLERVDGIEPTSPGWKPVIIAVILYPRKRSSLYRGFPRNARNRDDDGDSRVYLPEKNDVLTTGAFHQDMKKYPWVIVIQVGQNKRSTVLLDSAKQTFGDGEKRSFGDIYLHTFHR